MRAICKHCAGVIRIPKGTYCWEHEANSLARCPGQDTFALEDKSQKAPAAPKAKRTAETKPDPSEIRSWARLNGWEVGDRGRISQEITQAFLEATDT